MPEIPAHSTSAIFAMPLSYAPTSVDICTLPRPLQSPPFCTIHTSSSSSSSRLPPSNMSANLIRTTYAPQWQQTQAGKVGVGGQCTYFSDEGGVGCTHDHDGADLCRQLLADEWVIEEDGYGESIEEDGIADTAAFEYERRVDTGR